MIQIKIHVDIPQGAQDFYPSEYLPGDFITFNFDDEWFDLDHFLNLVCNEIKGAYKHNGNIVEYWKECRNEYEKTCKKEERQKDLQKSSRFHKKNKH